MARDSEVLVTVAVLSEVAGVELLRKSTFIYKPTHHLQAFLFTKPVDKSTSP